MTALGRFSESWLLVASQPTADAERRSLDRSEADAGAERGIDCLGLGCRVVSQYFNGNIGVTDWNDARLLHAQDSHVHLCARETPRGVDHGIALEAVGQCRY